MTQSEESPALALSDIVHIMSPSPAPYDDQDPLDEDEIRHFRARATALAAFDMYGPDDRSEREKELLEMVLKLTSAPGPSAVQLVAQADIISSLSEQRDMLFRQAEEQRLRWDAEREGWARMAEALIAQRTRNMDRDEEVPHQVTMAEAENKSLRHKLADAHARIAALEAEFSKLRPMLVMHAHAPRPPSAPPHSSSHYTPQHARHIPTSQHYYQRTPQQAPPQQQQPSQQQQSKPARFRRKDGVVNTDDEHPSAEEDAQLMQMDVDERPSTPAPPAPAPTTPRPAVATATTTIAIAPPTAESSSNAGPSELPSPSKRRIPPGHAHFVPGSGSGTSLLPSRNIPRPLTADARTEHLILAARRMGKQRAAALAGLTRDRDKSRTRDRDKDKDKDRRVLSGPTSPSRPKTPKTPARSGALGPGASAVGAPAHVGYVPYYSPAMLVPAYTMLATPGSSTAASASAPGSSTRPSAGTAATTGASVRSSAATKRSQASGAAGSHTPLDSLLSAARSMMHRDLDEDYDVDEEEDEEEEERASPTPGARRRGAAAANGRGGVGAAGRRGVAQQVQEPESLAPPAKRRRVSRAKNADTESRQGASPRSNAKADTKTGLSAGVNRVRSALDVLADQAAVVQSSTSTPTASGSGSRRRASTSAKGKEKQGEREKARGKGKPAKEKGKGRGKGKGKAVVLADENDEEDDEVDDDNEGGDPDRTPTIASRSRSKSGGSGSREGSAGRGSPGSATGTTFGQAGKETAPEDGGEGGTRTFKGGGNGTETGLNTREKSATSADARMDVDNPPAASTRTSTLPGTQAQPPTTSDVALSSASNVPGGSTQTPSIPTAPTTSPPTSADPVDSTGHSGLQLPSTSAPVPPMMAQAPSPRPGATNSPPLAAPIFSPPTNPNPSPILTQTTSVSPYAPAPLAGLLPPAAAKNKKVAAVTSATAADQLAAAVPGKRPRSPYVKWTREEDDLLAQAVAKYGQKWDLVQKALPSRGYHQVRQRWLRKLGVFDSKPDLSQYQTAATTASSGGAFGNGASYGAGYAGTGAGAGISEGATGTVPGPGPAAGTGSVGGAGAGGAQIQSVARGEPPPNPKLGLAPLSSEMHWAGSAGSSFGSVSGSRASAGPANGS